MNGLRKKLKDQSGASILLALLFFLLCCMVGSSVLMAAASNAGKTRSDRESQREYLLLSSALRLVCDELTAAEYTGAFTEETVKVEEKKDGEGNVIAHSYTYRVYRQTSGSFKCALSDVLPLRPELDRLFAGTFPPGGSGAGQGDDIYIPLPSDQTAAPGPHGLTLEVDAPGVPGRGKTVSVRVQMDEKYSIRLTATLGEKDGSGYAYTMEAQLTPSGTDPDMNNKAAGPRTWTLGWIAKKEAGDAA